MQYKVLKDFTSVNGVTCKEGDVIENGIENIAPEEISALIVSGNLDPIVESNLHEYETVIVDQAYLDANPKEVELGIKVGDEITRLKSEPELTADVETTKVSEAEVEKTLTFRGQEVISNGTRIVNGVEYHEVRLADGSTTDLSDEEYEAMIKNAQ